MHRIHKKKCYELRNPNKEDDLSCSHCDGIFKSKDDLQHHTLRVHEFGESFRIYPCEDCCFRGQDMKELEDHVSAHHQTQMDESLTLEELGIPPLPLIMPRKKQVISLDTSLESSYDNEYQPNRDELSDEESESDDFCPENIEKNKKRKVHTNSTQNKRQKVVKSAKKVPTSDFSCEICNAKLARKDSLQRHKRLKH